MKLNWTQGLSDKDKEDMERLVKGSNIVLNRLEDIIKGFDTETSSVSVKETEFDSPNWAYKQAYRAGKRSAYNQIIKLLDQGTN